MRSSKGVVIWVTGLSGAGKTTIASKVVDLLNQEGHPCVFMDGDKTRKALSTLLAGYEEKSRLAIAYSYSGLAKMLEDQGKIVVVATMSLFNEVQDWNRNQFSRYVEVFVDVPIEVLKKRDPKKLYAMAEKGLASNVAGVNMSYDAPSNPDLVLDNSKNIEEVANLANEIVTLVFSKYRDL